MQAERVERRLVAILAADVAGYSRLMGLDEEGTHARYKALWGEAVAPAIADHRGRVIKTMGDGFLAEFPSVLDATRCAVALQRAVAAREAEGAADRRLAFRMGIHIGDVIADGGDLFGDGVNVAARLEALASPGGICVSGDAWRQIRNRIELDAADLGEQLLKNIAEPVQVYALGVPGSAGAGSRHPAPRLPATSSVAVLPFTAVGGDPDQELFADGLTEDLITDLSRTEGLFVIASHSSFAYKGRALDVRQIARELGVRYLLEGSARRAGGRVRINAQLIDAVAGGHIWAERFERSLEDIFAVQDEVTAKIVQALIGRLTGPPPRNRPANLEAYDLCVRARLLSMRLPGSVETVREAVVLLRQAIALDPGYAEAHRWLGFNLNMLAAWSYGSEPVEAMRRQAREHAEKAVALDPNDAGNHWVLADVLAYEHCWSEAEAAFEAALALDPNHADAWAIRAEVTTLDGQPATAIEQVQRALRLNPHPAAWYYWVLGLAQYAAQDYRAAIETLRQDATYRTGSRRILAASLAQLGRMDEARREAALFLAGNPTFRISHWAAVQPCRDAATLAHFVEGYRKAGLPD